MKFKILFTILLVALSIESNGQTKTDKLIGIPVPVTYSQPIKAQGSTVYGYSSVAKAYTNNQVDMALLYNQAARLTDQAQQLAGRASSDFSTLVRTEGQNRAEIARIQVEGQSTEVARILAREQSAEIARILAREQSAEIARILDKERSILQSLEAQKIQASQFDLSNLLISTPEASAPEASAPEASAKTFVFYVTQTEEGLTNISQIPPATTAPVTVPAPAPAPVTVPAPAPAPVTVPAPTPAPAPITIIAQKTCTCSSLCTCGCQTGGDCKCGNTILASTVPTPTTSSSSTYTDRFLISETWCGLCPAAKRRFLQSGGKAKNILTMAEALRRHGVSHNPPYEYTGTETFTTTQSSIITQPATTQPAAVTQPAVTQQRSQAGRYVQYNGKTYDMETWRRMCNMRNCGMCQFLDNAQAAYRANRQTKVEPPTPQSSSPDDVIKEALVIMKLTPDDVLGELGCGSGLPMIAAVRQSGCRAVGVEIDPIKVAEAKHNVEAAGLSSHITIIQGDVRDFDPAKYGVTAVYAYLESDLLAQIKPQLTTGRITVCPGHKVDGIGMELRGQCWVRSSQTNTSLSNL